MRGVDGARRLTVVGLTSNDLKNGMNIEVDGVPMKVLEFLHVKPGKGAAFVRSKLKNLLNGSNMEKTFRAGESVGEAQVMKTDMQFSYDDGEEFQFMNMETYETEGVPKSVFVNNAGTFLLEGMVVQVGGWVRAWVRSGRGRYAFKSGPGVGLLLHKRLTDSKNSTLHDQLKSHPSGPQVTKWNDKAIDVELPPNFIYEVVETDPNFKGNTATGGSKPAKLNSGATVNVPMFIEVGEKIKVDTREATYLSRANE